MNEEVCNSWQKTGENQVHEYIISHHESPGRFKCYAWGYEDCFLKHHDDQEKIISLLQRWVQECPSFGPEQIKLIADTNTFLEELGYGK